jgi:hypothetical protein
MTWGFLLAALPWAYPDAISWQWAQSAPWRFALADGTFSILWGAYATGILIFMSRFPSDRPRGLLVLFDRIAIPLGVAVAIFGLLLDAGILFSASAPPAWALTTAYVTTSTSDRIASFRYSLRLPAAWS